MDNRFDGLSRGKMMEMLSPTIVASMNRHYIKKELPDPILYIKASFKEHCQIYETEFTDFHHNKAFSAFYPSSNIITLPPFTELSTIPSELTNQLKECLRIYNIDLKIVHVDDISYKSLAISLRKLISQTIELNTAGDESKFISQSQFCKFAFYRLIVFQVIMCYSTIASYNWYDSQIEKYPIITTIDCYFKHIVKHHFSRLKVGVPYNANGVIIAPTLRRLLQADNLVQIEVFIDIIIHAYICDCNNYYCSILDPYLTSSNPAEGLILFSRKLYVFNIGKIITEHLSTTPKFKDLLRTLLQFASEKFYPVIEYLARSAQVLEVRQALKECCKNNSAEDIASALQACEGDLHDALKSKISAPLLSIILSKTCP